MNFELRDPAGSLGSRALSHDSIFLADQAPGPSEPARVLSQENVHGKIRALQLKLQQQNMHLGPPPLLIPGKRTEDSGATSEDDGLPQSPQDMSFHDRAGPRSPSKVTVKGLLSSLGSYGCVCYDRDLLLLPGQLT